MKTFEIGSLRKSTTDKKVAKKKLDEYLSNLSEEQISVVNYVIAISEIEARRDEIKNQAAYLEPNHVRARIAALNKEMQKLKDRYNGNDDRIKSKITITFDV